MFKVYGAEYNIINIPQDAPILLKGRSGTGKTICCMYRMWISYKKAIVSTQAPTLHQLFVTRNSLLCGQMWDHFQQLCRGDRVTAKHLHDDQRQLPYRLQEGASDSQFPLMVTSLQLWLILDASLPEPHFFPRNADGSVKNPVIDTQWPVVLDDLDDDDEDEESTEQPTRKNKQGSMDDTKQLVTYEIFALKIWPCILRKHPVKFHASLVWMEIVSFIKGSYEAVISTNGYLDLDTYQTLGGKMAPNFRSSREQMYSLFEAYQQYIRRHGMFDEMDLVFSVYHRLEAVREQGPLPWTIHEIYVDETQDFTQAELFLLIKLAENPNRMFLTGDSAQSVMRGVAFRFDDLPTLFRHAGPMVEKPVQEQLTQNYRTHNGILRLATSVLDLLGGLFPMSFDRLEPDQGHFDGPAPVFLQAGQPSGLVTLIRSGEVANSVVEFGDHQVVLVMNEDSREKLPTCMKKLNVLTICESKGLEFDKVIIYNFFVDSQARGYDWETAIESMTDAKQFDEKKHKVLNAELKLLYTAVTRARLQVYFYDEDETQSGPMFRYFQAKGFATVDTVEGCIVRELQETCVGEGGLSMPKEVLHGCNPASSQRDQSSESGCLRKEEMERKGDSLMRKGLYHMAATYYNDAPNPLYLTIAVAYSRLKAAIQLACKPSSQQGEGPILLAYQKAALVFLEAYSLARDSGQSPQMLFYLGAVGAALCLVRGGKRLQAAQILCKNREWRKAGKLFEKEGKAEEANRCLINMRQDALSTTFNQSISSLNPKEASRRPVRRNESIRSYSEALSSCK